ncbi:hypothetical protein GV828_03030 [Flavobacterium sp. NST-5]|uniref:Uncharacterized protein n=1 Tax=Flavobacterium ichthyis TaxID=2698827 RepID=A0ABW9Z641_9FLAO|nr:hypothetical protein [Flavobacterium ichthyis]NBL64171.1 hypothetical protein [Flavobacterium ichthyis]
MIIGIAAGAAAVTASILIAKKLHVLDKLLCRAEGLTGKLTDYCDVLPKGEEKNVSKEFK